MERGRLNFLQDSVFPFFFHFFVSGRDRVADGG